MARYTDESKERVRDAADFVEIVGARTELRRSGVARMEGLCPFHDERSPSFGISPGEKVYYCFGCGAGGDVFKFVMETEGLDFTGALESLAERYRVPLEREAEDPRDAAKRQRRERLFALLERTAAYYVRVLWESPDAAAAREYLASRGLEESALRAYRVGFAPDTWDRVLLASQKSGYSAEEVLAAGLATRTQRGTLIDRFRGRITFPLTDERGRVLGFGARAMKPDDKPKYLNTSESELFHKGRIVYGADMARAAAAKAGRVVLVEGYTDVIALHQAGVPETVAQMGTALTDSQVEAIARLAPKALFCQDPDRAGQESVAKGIAALRTYNKNRTTRGVEFRIVRLPAGLDPADVVQQQGAETMRSTLDQAMPIERFEVERILDTPDVSTDEKLAAAAQAIAGLPSSVLQSELVRLIAGRLGLSEALVNEVLLRRPATPPPPQRHYSPPPQRQFPPPPPRSARPATPPPSAPARPAPAASGPGDIEEPPPMEWDGFSGAEEDPGDWGAFGEPAGQPSAPAGAGQSAPAQPPAPQAGGAAGWTPGDPGAGGANTGWTPGGDPGWGGGGNAGWGGPRPGGRDWGPRQQPWTGRGGNRQRRGGGRDRFRGPMGPQEEPMDPRTALIRPERTERAFLSYCLALPEEGERRLSTVDVEDCFSAPATRQAATYLRGRLRAPTANLPSGDEALARLVAELVVNADRLEATNEKLALEGLQLELNRIDRHIAKARTTGAAGVSALAAERQKVLDEIRHRMA